jgi:hypothetical protein
MTDIEPLEEPWQEDLRGIREDQRRRLMTTGVAGSLIVVAGLILTIWLLVIVSDRSHDQDRIDRLETRTGAFSDDQGRLANAVDELRLQVERLGATPVAPPPEQLIEQQGASDPDDPDPNDPESQDPERQDPERQDPERQDPEAQDPEANDLDPFDDLDLFDDPDPIDDPDPNDPEIQDPEIDDPEIQDPAQIIIRMDFREVDTNVCVLRITFADQTSITSDEFDCPGGTSE